jgi:hypothetical protein
MIEFGLSLALSPIAGFATLGLFAIWVAVAVFRRIPNSVPAP